ncbi:MAG: hypothetical protein WAV23_01850 [Minisyncoccia bacterium]
MLQTDEVKKIVGVVRGGVEPYYKNSLQEGSNIISSISKNLSNKYKAVDILIDKDGIWHINGIPINPEDITDKVDIIWNTSHPNLSKVFEDLSIPLVGVNSFKFSSAESKNMLEKHMKEIKVKMPRHLVLPLYQEDIDGSKEKYAVRKAKDVFEKFSSPWLVKSLSADISMGVHVANIFPELVNAIEDGIEHGHGIIVEELIIGKLGSVHSLAGFREKNIYSFPPRDFSFEEKEKLLALARDIYKHTGAESYLKIDFILTPNRGIFLKDICYSPGLNEDSSFCQSCESVGAKPHHAVEHILESGLL